MTPGSPRWERLGEAGLLGSGYQPARGSINWTEDHERLFAKIEAVDPITPAGRRRQSVEHQKDLGRWLEQVADEQACQAVYDRRRRQAQANGQNFDPWGWGAAGIFELERK